MMPRVACDRVTNPEGVFEELSLYTRGSKTFSFLASGFVTLSQVHTGRKAIE